MRECKDTTDQVGISKNAKIVPIGDHVTITEDFIEAKVEHKTNAVNVQANKVYVHKNTKHLIFRTNKRVPRHGVLLVGSNGSNSTTLIGGILANKKGLTWKTRKGIRKANYYGSICESSTVKLGVDQNGKLIHVPFSTLIPILHPNDLVFGGWDIREGSCAQAMIDAQVLHTNLQEQLIEDMEKIKAMPSVYDPDFIAPGMKALANNTLPMTWKKEQYLTKIQSDIHKFKETNQLDSVTVFWIASTERMLKFDEKLHGSADALLEAIEHNESEISPSMIFAVAAILGGCSFINGSPQQTLTEGVIELAKRHNCFLAGNDLKTGQTKLKSVLVDAFVSMGFKPTCIYSGNFLGNLDGFNLDSRAQFQSKKVSKSNVVEDACAMNPILYPDGERPDHAIDIRYLKFVGDSKKALDSYISEIFLNGIQEINLSNSCEDSLLAAPLMADMIVLIEFLGRVKYRDNENSEWKSLHVVQSLLSAFMKAPVVPKASPIVNTWFKQLRALTNFITSCCLGLCPDGDLLLEQVLQ